LFAQTRQPRQRDWRRHFQADGGFSVRHQGTAAPAAKLMNALPVVVDFSVEHPARYRLLFSDPAIVAQKGKLERTALTAFGEFIMIVEECQVTHALPDLPNTTLAGLLFATMHGLIALKASGRMHPEKGLTGVRSSLELLIDRLSPRRKVSASKDQ
jgi:hypothetical protein